LKPFARRCITRCLAGWRWKGIAHSLAEIGLDDEAAVWVGEQALADTSSSDTNACPLSAADYSQIFINAVHGVLPGVNV